MANAGYYNKKIKKDSVEKKQKNKMFFFGLYLPHFLLSIYVVAKKIDVPTAVSFNKLQKGRTNEYS